jgi:hypothetical protein
LHSVNYAAELVHSRHTLSSTIINSHQEPVSGQACNPFDPNASFLLCVEEFYGTQYQSGPVMGNLIANTCLSLMSTTSPHRHQRLVNY